MCCLYCTAHTGQLGLGDDQDRWAPNQVQRLHTSAQRYYDLRMSFIKPWKVKQVGSATLCSMLFSLFPTGLASVLSDALCAARAHCCCHNCLLPTRVLKPRTHLQHPLTVCRYHAAGRTQPLWWR